MLKRIHDSLEVNLYRVVGMMLVLVVAINASVKEKERTLHEGKKYK